MYGRKELESHLTHINCSFFKCYLADDADKVMDAMEQRIKELESIPHTDNTAVIDNLQARIKELEATISKMETTEPKWISVKNRLPNESTFVKVKLESGTKRKMMYVDGNWFDCNEFLWDNEEDKVTHWKSLPPPPTTEDSLPIEKEKKVTDASTSSRN